MRPRLAVAMLSLFVAGCASQPLHSKSPATQASLRADPSGASSVPAERRVALPYMFIRHGVEIRVNSIESSGNQVLVSVTLQETKGQTSDLLTSTMIQVLTAAGQALPFVQYSREDKPQGDPIVHLAARDQFSITLIYQAEAGSTEASNRSLELRFPTGKYWNSRGAD